MCEGNKPKPIVIEVAKHAPSGNILMGLAREYHQRLEWGEAIKYITMAMTKGNRDYPSEAQALHKSLLHAISR